SRSVTAATMKTQARIWDPSRPCATRGKRSRTGTAPVRRIVMVLGRFQRRSARRPAGVRTAGSSREVAIVAAIVVEDALDVLARLRIRRDAAVLVDGARAGVVGRQGVPPVAVAIHHRPQIAS